MVSIRKERGLLEHEWFEIQMSYLYSNLKVPNTASYAGYNTLSLFYSQERESDVLCLTSVDAPVGAVPIV